MRRSRLDLSGLEAQPELDMGPCGLTDLADLCGKGAIMMKKRLKKKMLCLTL